MPNTSLGSIDDHDVKDDWTKYIFDHILCHPRLCDFIHQIFSARFQARMGLIWAMACMSSPAYQAPRFYTVPWTSLHRYCICQVIRLELMLSAFEGLPYASISKPSICVWRCRPPPLFTNVAHGGAIQEHFTTCLLRFQQLFDLALAQVVSRGRMLYHLNFVIRA